MISQIPFPRKYLTKRGVIDARDIIPGDYLYEWRTNKPLEVKSVQNITYHNMYEATYSDGRIEYYTNHELVYLEEYVLPPHDPFCMCRRTWQFPITLYPIRFNEDQITSPLDPDPYIAGALIIYGDQDDPYINCPKDRTEFYTVLANKYHVELHPRTRDGKNYFKWEGSLKEDPITWKEFFSKYDFYATNHDNETLIPPEYMQASVKDRTQFIRGVFDTGYIQSQSPDQAAIFFTKPCMVAWIQSILWSMGIPNKITYTEDTTPVWKLEITGKFNHYPGFFYNRKYIENMINADYRTPTEYANKVTIVRTRPLEYCPIAIHNPVPHIYLEKPHMFYTSVNYLPRVSM